MITEAPEVIQIQQDGKTNTRAAKNSTEDSDPACKESQSKGGNNPDEEIRDKLYDHSSVEQDSIIISNSEFI